MSPYLRATTHGTTTEALWENPSTPFEAETASRLANANWLSANIRLIDGLTAATFRSHLRAQRLVN
jgi:hypothetical protein